MTERIEEFGFFVERARAEHTPEWKQIIPYTIVVRDGQVLCLTRTKQGGESRLHDKLSIGVGGHINPIDLPSGTGGLSLRNPIAKATEREVLEEELSVEGTYTLRPLGLLNDDSNPVGAVHVGWVQLLTATGDVQVREVDQLEGNFRSVSELQDMQAEGANFETWSSLLIPSLGQFLSSSSKHSSQRPKHQPQ
ncbi:MAG: NUDIX hydrolase [Planctomycetes bacterium]|nr:NUDIX hydrolase [Planctomycetota bacterium]